VNNPSVLSTRDQYITIGEPSAFLFQPSFLLQPVHPLAGNHWTDGALHRALPANPQIGLALGAALAATATLKALDSEGIDGLPIDQSYFMSDIGTVMIRRNSLGRLDSTYLTSFRPSRFFAERPYFWRAVDGTQRSGSFDYVTEPYIDHGGLGAVRTYVKVLKLPNGRRAIIGMDCSIPNGEKAIIDKLRRIAPPVDQLRSRRPRIVIATKDRGHLRFAAEDGSVPAWLSDMSDIFSGTTAEVTGQITSDHDHGNPANPDVFQFAIPVGKDPASGGMSTRIVLAEVNLDQMRNLWLPGILCVVMSLLFGAMLHFFYHQHVVQRREQERVLNKVASIMRDAPTPFCWLNEHNEFIYANARLIELLGYRSLADLQEHPTGFRRTFREMLDLQDQAAYDALLRRSAHELPTDRYTVRVRTNNNAYFRVDVHGERMPFGGVWRNEGPHRFGVFLGWVAIPGGSGNQTNGKEGTLPGPDKPEPSRSGGGA
jgi:PAS domain-containing protein